MKISVIFSTYNSIDWLIKVLWGFHYQTDNNFEVIIADDGSNNETKQAIDTFSKNTHLTITHVWQSDDGFRKCIILNKAIEASTGDYLILTDGDCIPRSDFIAVHREYAEPGYYLSGGYFKLPMATSNAITQSDIKNGNAFNSQWLIKNGLKDSHKTMKLNAKGLKAKLYNHLTLTRTTWNGHNASCFKSEALKVNGFDERMQYGGEDCEFGDRLKNSGLKTKQIRYSAICVHLDHSRGYVSDEAWAKNRKIREETIKNKNSYTKFGIIK